MDRALQPIKLNVQIFVPGVVSLGGKMLRSRTTIAQVPFNFETMVYGLRRIVYRGEVNDRAIYALAFIPEQHRCHLGKSNKGRVTEELCWVDAPIALNGKGRDAHALTAFLESGDLEWLLEEKV